MFGIENYANLHFYLLYFLLIPLIALFIWSKHRKEKRMAAFAHSESMKKIADSMSRPKIVIKQVLLCISFCLLIFAILRPQGNPQDLNKPEDSDDKDKDNNSSLSLEDISKGKDGKKAKIRESARDVIFLLDVSGSMGAEDLTPNRLERAKDMIADTVSAMNSEHVGLIIFTSVPSVKSILTLDYSYFKSVLRTVNLNDNDYTGTKFTAALTEIIDRQFDFSKNKYKELIIITDGGDTDVEGLQGEQKEALENSIYELAKRGYEEKGIRIHTVGIGSRKGSVLPGLKDEKGNPVKSSLNEAFLQKIAKNASGIYVPAADNNVNMEDIYRNKIVAGTDKDVIREKEINVDENKLKELVQKEKQQKEKKMVYEEFFIYPCLLLIILLIVENFITVRKKPKKGAA